MRGANGSMMGLIAIGLAAQIGAASTGGANEYASQLKKVLDEKVRPWMSDAVVVESIRAQNDANASLDQVGIDALDQEWRSEAGAGGGAMIDGVLANALSEHLKTKKAANGELFTEIFVMDNRGLNVGQSDVTSDYWQGDEAKWQETFGAGADAYFIDEIEFDDSSEMFQAQVSAAITDPATGEPIGAITFGVNVENLE
jgi:hypothetical protein